jgi:plastocyanin
LRPFALLLPLALACGGDDRNAPPEVNPLSIDKTSENSGDKQLAIGGSTLHEPLRVVVMRDGLPVEGVTVFWRTTEGTVVPRSDLTDANGVSSATWTLDFLLAEQIAVATFDTLTQVPRVVFTARSIPGPQHGTLIQVLTEGGNRFEPAEVTVPLGETVNWYWPPNSSGHNVVPDDGDSPPQTGPLEAGPISHSFTFTVPGVYHYHCAAHGAAGGVGMSGTVTVLSTGPEPK